jgi:hypothetical protein
LSDTLKAFAQPAPDARVGRIFDHSELGSALPAEVFLSLLHWTITGDNGHGADLPTGPTSLAVLGPFIKRHGNVYVLSPPHKSKNIGLPNLTAHADATATENAGRVVEWITHFDNTTSNRQILNGPRVGSFCDQQFGNVSPQLEDFLRMSPNDHPFLDLKGAGCGNPRLPVLYYLHQAQAADPKVNDTPHMTEMGDTDAMIESRIEDTSAMRNPDLSAINSQRHIFEHILSYLTMTASNLHSSLQIPHLEQISSFIVWVFFLSPVMAP